MEQKENLNLGIAKYIPFTRTRRIWKQQLNSESRRLDTEHMTEPQIEIYNIRHKQLTSINITSWTLISLIITLWGFYYSIPFLQDKMSFLAMGMHQTDPSWSEHMVLWLVPMFSGTILHNAPKIVPNKKAQAILHIGIKIIPFLLMVICYVLVHYERKIISIKKEIK